MLLTTTTPGLRCIDCGRAVDDPAGCLGCGQTYPVRDGILHARGELTGKNRVAADFYNSDRWQKFRFWEQLFLRINGGLPGARMQILRHLQPIRPASLLEVGVGNGENVALLPPSVRVTAIDISERMLAECRDRHANRGITLALAEGERVPFADASFDATICVGGFNFFSDPPKALREMVRVTRPGGRILVADESPDLYGWSLGHLLDWPALDRWMLDRFWFGPEFTAMVLGNRLDAPAVARSVLSRFRFRKIWNGLGYCIIGDI